MVIWDANHRRGGERINKALGDSESTMEGIPKKTFPNIEAEAGMAERLVRYLAIEQALQEEIKGTLEHNNQSYGDWCDLSDKNAKITRLNLPCNMIWAGRRDHLVGDTTPLQDIPSSSAEEKKESSEWSSIPRPVGSVTMQKRKDKKQKTMSAQRTSREAQKVWKLQLY